MHKKNDDYDYSSIKMKMLLRMDYSAPTLAHSPADA
jgi:hypothetical protein